MKAFIPRQVSQHIRELAEYFPVLSLTGPRQAGKTTLLRQLFAGYRYVSFEDVSFRDQFTSDPVGFLDLYDRNVIFDEAQRVPDLFSYLQTRVDEDRSPARFILSGSQNFLLLQNITQSLAGRVGIVRLFPFDFTELKAVDLLAETPAEAIYQGFYPEGYQTDLPPHFFYPNYVSSYLSRDVSHLVKESNMRDFRRLMQLCAALVGQTIEYSYFAKRLQISVPTVKKWLHHLEASYVVFTIGPYYDNFGKRLVKSPKLYFTDTGLACYLLQLTSQEAVKANPLYGALFENLVIANKYKTRYHNGNQHPFYFYRDNHQLEVDVLEKTGATLHLTEVKATATYHDRLTGNLRKVAKAAGPEVATELQVIYGGKENIEADGVRFVPWRGG